jgi:hypothetical protein
VNRGGKPKAKKRKPSETLRIYGGEDRLVWVASQPCIICGLRACDNAHVATGGMGRKADARFIVPLCSPDHRELHQIGVASFEKRYSIDLLQLAAQTEAAWRASPRTRAPK